MESTAPNRRQQIFEVLKRYWGFTEFRPVQERIIRSAMAGRDTLALMPTGGGKSLTYQIPGLASEGVCIVVTPLIALMKDQVDRLRKLGIRALAIHSGLSARQIDIDLDNCVYGDVKFLYVAPERLASEAFRLRVQRMNVSLLAVDEAHCISQWGYDFRPSYLRIAELRERIPGVPVLALTASATPRVADDIMEKLRFAEPHLLRSDFSRPNLSYAVRHTDDKNEQLLRIIRNVGGSGIVYVRTREGAEQVAAFLRDEGISAEYYHGGLGHAERSMRQEAWISGRTPVMVATNAFGMGIDKPDVRYVVHYTMCDSLESYYQEAGRAGRDGRRSYAVLLISSDDAGRIAKRFEADYPPLEKIRSIYEKICSYLQIAIGDGAQSSFLFNLRDFCTREHLYTGLVQNALKILSQNGYMTLLDEAANPARILFCVSRDDLYRIRVQRDELDHFIRTLPGGYQMELNEDASNVSQGQKQLLCIARVMLCLPPMLILDEATSSIDTRTEVRIQAAFARMMQGRTSFIVAHRLSTIREADVILVMKDGHIVEQGDHDTLLAQGGFYAKLYNSQFEGVET